MKKDIEIYRMNFLSRGKAAFTYKNMAMALAGWTVFLMLFFVAQFARQALIKRDIAATKKTVEALNVEKERQIEAIQALGRKSVGTSVRKDLTGMLELRPLWSKVLDRLGRALPAQVWLESASTAPVADGTISLSIFGKARTQRDITNFIMQLESGSFFQRTSLIKTKQAEGGEGLQDFEVVTYPQLGKFQ